ncbi:MAG: hypothetical protein D3916_12585, partial [Candidatus Electrothrix sp. MAN1_4]|nr:hypothetical protein [Candidatus Electrothrix sp. MAN1_4]
MPKQHCFFLKMLRKIKLTDKLSLFAIFGVLVSVCILGWSFDSFLKETFLEDAKSKILYGFHRLSTDLETETEELKEGIFFVRTDEHFLASVELINNYQDKKNYNAILLDEEKKIIAQQLLNRVKLSLNHFISLYDKNEELIAFVEYSPDGYHLHFISYEKGHRVLYSRHEDEQLFVRSPFPATLPVTFKHLGYYSNNEAEKGTITYHVHNGKILASSHISI